MSAPIWARVGTEYLPKRKSPQLLPRTPRKSIIKDLLKRDLSEATRKTLERRLAELD